MLTQVGHLDGSDFRVPLPFYYFCNLKNDFDIIDRIELMNMINVVSCFSFLKNTKIVHVRNDYVFTVVPVFSQFRVVFNYT